MQEINSPQNPKLKAALQLHSSRGRKKQGRFIVFGDRECRRTLKADIKVHELFICQDQIPTDRGSYYTQQAADVPKYVLPRSLMEKLEFGDRADGVAVIAERPQTTLDLLVTPQNCLTVVLESIEKPGNLGAILRSCDGAGVDSVILADPLTDFFHHNCIRASMGAVFSMKLATATTSEVLKYLQTQSFAAFAAVVDATTDFQNANYQTPRTAIVFGNESQGLSELWRTGDCTPIFIPMRGIGDSLNVSVSVAIVAYEASGQRQRNQQQP